MMKMMTVSTIRVKTVEHVWTVEWVIHVIVPKISQEQTVNKVIFGV